MKLLSQLNDVKTINSLLNRAEIEAQASGDDVPGAEHLMLAALALPEGSARRAFEAAGADPDKFHPAISAVHDEALRAVGVEPLTDTAPAESGSSRTYRMTASGRAAFDAAGRLARADKQSNLRGAHVVFAVAQMEHGTAARALRHMGVDRHALAGAALSEIEAQHNR